MFFESVSLSSGVIFAPVMLCYEVLFEKLRIILYFCMQLRN